MLDEWDPRTGEISPPPAARGYWFEAPERPEQWYRENAAVFGALEEWSRRWEEWARDYEYRHGRPPSSTNRAQNKAAFRRLLIERYGRGEPDAAWLDLRDAHLEKRGQRPERESRQ